MIAWLRSLFCTHFWVNRWESRDGTPVTYAQMSDQPDYYYRVWRCTKCGKIHSVQYLPIPKRRSV